MINIMEEMSPDAGLSRDRADIFNIRLMSQRLKDCGFKGDARSLIERSLLYLHDVKIITLQNGLEFCQ